jgi:hypothetical protein
VVIENTLAVMGNRIKIIRNYELFNKFIAKINYSMSGSFKSFLSIPRNSDMDFL